MNTKISFSEKLGYGLNNFGSGTWQSFLNTFLLYFYTNVAHFRPAVASTIISLAVIWDAINDPLFASLADNHRFRNGEKMRPLLFSCFPLAVLMVLMFVTYGDPTVSKVPVVISFVVYFLFRIPSTLHTLPLNGMKQLATPDDKERVSINTWASGGGAFGIAVSSIIFWPIIRGVAGLDASGNMINPKTGFIVGSACAGGIVIAASMFHYFTSKERIFDNFTQKMSFKDCCKVLLSYREFNLNLAMMFLYGLYATIISGYNLYYCTYVINKPGIASAVMATYVVGIVITLPFVNKIYSKLGRKKTIGLGTLVLIACCAVFVIFSKQIFAPFVLCAGIGIGTELITVMLMLNRADITDIISEREGIRMDGMVNNVMFFVQKIGNALLTFILGLIMEYAHFDGTLTAQPASAVLAIVLIMGLTGLTASAGIFVLSRQLRIDGNKA